MMHLGIAGVWVAELEVNVAGELTTFLQFPPEFQPITTGKLLSYGSFLVSLK